MAAAGTTIWSDIILTIYRLGGRALHRVVLLACMIIVRVTLIRVRVEAISDATDHAVVLAHGRVL